jgi:hypothetical protein
MTKGITKYLLLFIGLVVFLASYFLVYMNLTEKTDAINTEKAALEARLDILEGYYAKLPEYREGIEDNREKINIMLSRYYNVEQPEDFIMFATAMENEIGVGVTTLAFADPEPIAEIAGVKESEADDEKVPAEPLLLTAFGISSDMTGTMNYAQMKKALEFIYNQKDATTLDSLNVSFDSSTGLLLGNFTINKYFITGRDNVNHQAEIPFGDVGNSLLMGG